MKQGRQGLVGIAVVSGLLVVILLQLPGVAYADDQLVVNMNDAGAGSLRQAIQDVHDGGTITFNLGDAPATITLTSGELAIGKSLTIAGPGADRLTISGNDSSRVFSISAGTVTISGVTVAHGRVTGAPAEGGAIRNAGHLILQQVLVKSSRAEATGNVGADAFGGGLYSEGACLLENSTVYSNTAQGGPNTAYYGGDGAGGGIHNQGQMTLTHSYVLENLARGGPTSGWYGGPGLGGGLSNAVTGTITIQNSTVAQNRAEGGTASVHSDDRYGGRGNGGGLYNAGMATVQETSVVTNTALGGAARRYGGEGSGGGINNTGELTVIDGTIQGNVARGTAATQEYCGDAEGGGIASRGSLTVIHSTVAGNIARGADGPVAGYAEAGGISGLGRLSIEESTLCNNQALGGNGTYWTYGKVAGDANAGAVYSFATQNAVHTIISTTICSNLALGGQGDMGGDATAGGIYSYYTLTVEASTIVANVAQGGLSPDKGSGGDADGGGAYGLGSFTLAASTVQENQALGGEGKGYSYGGNARGGGVNQSTRGAFVIVGSTIVSNSVQGGSSVNSRGGDASGGGYSDSYASDEYSPTVRCLNATFQGNRAVGGLGKTKNGTGVGGGLRAGPAAAALSFCTIAGNTAADQGGGLFSTAVDDDQGPAIRNTILADNAAPAGPDIYGNVQSRGYNLVKDTTGGTLDTAGGNNTAEGNLLGVDPRLGPLQDNGGPTWTRALVDGDNPSPAIDAGSSTDVEGNVVSVDQRGYLRPSPVIGKHDIGAFECQSPMQYVYLPLVVREE